MKRIVQRGKYFIDLAFESIDEENDLILYTCIENNISIVDNQLKSFSILCHKERAIVRFHIETSGFVERYRVASIALKLQDKQPTQK